MPAMGFKDSEIRYRRLKCLDTVSKQIEKS
jgi:hypothetical protein